jgi:hypothetical protein
LTKAKSFFDKVGRIIVTNEIFEDKKSLRTLYRYFLTGMLVRLLFLPFFYQRDLLSTFQRAATTIDTGNYLHDFMQFLNNMIHTAYLLIINWLSPAVQKITPALLDQNTWTSWITFNSNTNVFTVLSLFKILYLIFDICCMFLIIRLAFDGEPEKRLRVFKYWIFSPLVIFVLYIFARHDIMGILVTLIALLLAKKERKYWSLLVLAVGILLRFFPIMILPLLIFYLVRSKKDYIILTGIGVSGLALIEAFSFLRLGHSLILSLLGTEHFEFLIAPKLDLVAGSHSSIFIFIAVYTAIVLSFLHVKNKSFDLLINYCAIVYVAYVGICYFHPQYLLWTTPFLVILSVRRRSLLYYGWILFALLMAMLIYWGNLVTTFVFAPLDARYFIYLPGIIPVIARSYDVVEFVNIFRSLFTGVSIWMVFLLYRDGRQLELAEISPNNGQNGCPGKSNDKTNKNTGSRIK